MDKHPTVEVVHSGERERDPCIESSLLLNIRPMKLVCLFCVTHTNVNQSRLFSIDFPL